MSGLYLAIDVGTTIAKVAAFSTAGNLKAFARRELRVRYPRPGEMEIDPEEWWRVARRLIRQVLADGRIHPRRVLAICPTGLMHALVPLAAAGQTVSSVMLWPDQRGVSENCELMARHRDLWQRIAGSPVPWWGGAAKLRYLVANKPDDLRRTTRLVLCKDFVRYRLTGELGTDLSDALSTHLVDQSSGRWSAELLEAVGVSGDLMPDIRLPHEPVGSLQREAAAQTGLLEGTPVICGAGDSHTTLLGANMYVPYQLCLYLGTAAWVMQSVTEQADWHPLVDPELTIRFLGSTSTFGASLDWCRRLVFQGSPRSRRDRYREMEELARRAPPGCEGLIFRPHLMGERGPQADPHLRGSLENLTLAHGKSHVARSVMEGNAFHLRRLIPGACLEGIERMVAVGGGSRSPLWREIIASVLNRPLQLLNVPEATALGAAMLAAVGVRQFARASEAARAWVHDASVQDPNPDWAEVYRSRCS